MSRGQSPKALPMGGGAAVDGPVMGRALPEGGGCAHAPMHLAETALQSVGHCSLFVFSLIVFSNEFFSAPLP